MNLVNPVLIPGLLPIFLYRDLLTLRIYSPSAEGMELEVDNVMNAAALYKKKVHGGYDYSFTSYISKFNNTFFPLDCLVT